VTIGQTVAILESMKMEIPLQATAGGVVTRLLCQPGQMVSPGQRLMVVAQAGTGYHSE
jgi:urea carboxylase